MILKNIKFNTTLAFYSHSNKLIKKYFIKIHIFILIITYYSFKILKELKSTPAFFKKNLHKLLLLLIIYSLNIYNNS